VKLSEEDSHALFMIDQELATRVYNPPAAE